MSCRFLKRKPNITEVDHLFLSFMFKLLFKQKRLYKLERMVRWIYSHFSLLILINETKLAQTIYRSSLINYSKEESLPLLNVNRVTCSIYHLHKSVYYVNAFIYWIYSWTIHHIDWIIEIFRRQSLMVLYIFIYTFQKKIPM